MLFTEPCCKALKVCLESGDDPTFHRVGGDSGPLLVRTASRLYRAQGGQQREFVNQAVIFCPFCGTRLQRAEDVARYLSGGES